MKRVQLDFEDDEVGVLDELAKDTSLSTRKALFTNAITLLEWAVNEVKQGNKVGSSHPDGSFSEITMPAFGAVKRKYPKP